LIFIDTGAFLARYLERDQYHQVATEGWRELRSSLHRCATSNFVLDETFTLLARRASYPFAAERARQLLASDVLEILRPDAEDELEALRRFEKFADQGISYTDCISFTLMHRHRLELAFTFDRHFTYAGFIHWPEGMFQVHEPVAEYDA